METVMVQTQDLRKTYRAPEREAGLRAALRGMLRPTYREVEAVRGISFEIRAGERVGLIGQNGAGKTTTLKMLAGLLHPSGGSARVAGFDPSRRQPEFLRRISMVLGNKSQMLWDIPALDTFRVLGEIYSIPEGVFQERVKELMDLLDLGDLARRPVRNLSLGERMKCELAAGLLHAPDVLFLDEPTLGLDVSMQARLRAFVAEYNRRRGATVLLTSHYMADLTALCERVILIHAGGILYDGALDGLAHRLAPYKLLKVALSEPARNLSALGLGDVLEQDNERFTLRVGREQAPEATARLLQQLPVVDLVVEDPPIEAVIDRIYQEGSVA